MFFSRKGRLSAAVAAMTCLGSALALHAQDKGVTKAPTIKAPTDLGTRRWLACLSTDKPLYRPGEVVYARAAILDAFSRAPSPDRGAAGASFQVRSPSGSVVFQQPSVAERGIAAFSWTIPEDAAGGEYKLVANLPGEGLPEGEIAFDVRAYRVPRLNADLDFEKKAYGAGERVTATLKATRAEGGVPVGAVAAAFATVDGGCVHRSQVALDATGSCTLSFALPARIQGGEGTLAITVRDGGVQETVARTIPIVLNRVKLETFPEGGDLVLGLPARLYFEARTPKGKPAFVAGRIVLASDGSTVARFKSSHEGRGRVAFTPSVPGNAYSIVLDEPAGATDPVALPTVLSTGFALATLDDTVEKGELVRLRVTRATSGKARVVLSQREHEVASLPVELEAGKPEDVVLAARTEEDGVLRATVEDESGTPRAERLLFRRPSRALKVELVASEARGALRDHVSVTVRTRDESGKAVPAMVTLSAVDDAVLETVERRERAPRLPVQALLGNEVRELGDAHVYLETGAAAAEKIDLLLGTQGWRRFAFRDPLKFAEAHGAAGERILALRRSGEGTSVVLFPAAAEGDHNESADGEDFARMKGEDLNIPLAGRGPGVDLAIGVGAGSGGGARFGARFGGRRAPAQPAGLDPRAAARRPGERARARAARAAQVARVVREFAHAAASSLEDGRTDFAETLYWNAGLTTNEKGEATFAFDLADSVTTIRVKADAFSANGALGAGDATVEARRPFYVEPRLPLEVSAGDTIEAPLALVNGTTTSLTPEIELALGKLLSKKNDPLCATMGPDARSRTFIALGVGQGRGDATVRIKARAGSADDDVTRTIHVEPAGFPIEMAYGGRLEEKAVHVIRIPEGVEPGSLVTEGMVYPSPLASLAQATQALLREPCG